MRRCRSCDVEKPNTEFHRHHRDPSGLAVYCKPCKAAKAKKSRAASTRHAEYNREYAKQNRDKVRAARKKWRARSKDKIRGYQDRYRRANLDKVAEKQARRRARIKNSPVIEKIDRKYIYERDGGRCHICGLRVPYDKLSLDHLNPLAYGGEHTNANLRVAHLACNVKRGAGRTPAQLLLVA
jgi:5-methylcytosine-specific restriction endonuclease McrA